MSTNPSAHELEIERLNRLYAALAHVSQAIVRMPARDELFRTVCRILVEDGGFRMAWIGWHDGERHTVVPVAQHGDESGYVDDLLIATDDGPESRGPTGTAFREKRRYICNDMVADPATMPWRAEILRREYRASAVFPIEQDGEVRGALNVYSERTAFFQDKEVALLDEVALEISFALDNLAREQARQREKGFSDNLIEALPGILYLYDTSGRFLRWNRNFEIVSGYSAEKIATMHPLDFFAGAEKAQIAERIAEGFEKGEVRVEASLVAKDGRVVPHFFTGKRIELDGMTCLVGVGVDIAKRREAELALRELNESLERKVAERTAELEAARFRAEAADRVKSAFLATMSHELRTPLNSIIGFTGIILQGLAGPLNAEQAKQLGMVQGSARHLLELINDVLDISKIEAGQLEVRSVRFDLRASIERVVASVKPLAEKKGLAISAVLPSSLAETEIESDRRRVEQILLNLLNNAIKFTDHGGVTLVADVVAEPPSIRLAVKDTGIGINEADLTKLFQPFRQLDSGLQRQHEGTGLGLAISGRLTRLLGGTIRVESALGQGSMFEVTLPVNRRTS